MDELIKKLELLKKRLQDYEKNLSRRVGQILSLDEVSEAIITLIQRRIYEQGTLADGEKLITDSARYQIGQQAYSIRNQTKKNKSHVDLYVSGEFFDQWLLNAGTSITKITADKIKTIYENFQDSFNSSADMMDKLGTLSPEEIEIVSKQIILPYIEADFQAMIKDV